MQNMVIYQIPFLKIILLVNTEADYIYREIILAYQVPLLKIITLLVEEGESIGLEIMEPSIM